MSTNLAPDTQGAEAPDVWQPPRESMPSQVRADEPMLARWIGFGGLGLLTLGVCIFILQAKGRSSALSEFLWPLLAVSGLGGILFHALRDVDLQVRRTYGSIGYAWLGLGFTLSALPIKGPAGALFLPYGFTAFVLALLFLMPYIRNEGEPGWHRAGLYALGG